MDAEANRRFLRQRAYAMKKHHATRLHYDLRLEWREVLLSWALPGGASLCAGSSCEAVEMDDHRRANLLFEGVHASGPIMLWDRGTWEPHPECDDVDRCLREGSLRFTLRGERLKGEWALSRTQVVRHDRRIWTLYRHNDAFAGNAVDPRAYEAWPNSVGTGRTMEEIVRDWTGGRKKRERQAGLFGEP